MIIFAIIVFALAGVRTLAKMIETYENKESGGSQLGSLVVAITYWWCYIWFLSQYILLK